MDYRWDIIQSVTDALKDKVSNEIADIVQDTLTIELNKYEISERCTDIVTKDTSQEKMLKKFIATKRIEGLSESSLQRYWYANMELIQFLQKPLPDITTYDLRFYLSYRRDKGNISNRSLDGMRRCYSSFFSWLLSEGFISKNPCAALKQIKYRKTVKKPYSAVDMEKLKECCNSIRDLALIEFLYCTGCRVSEVSNLDITDIDFESMECHVIGKGNKERIVYLSSVASMHLQEYLKSRNDICDALFIGRTGERLSKNGIEAVLKRLGKQAGVENVHPPRYRRTLATNLLDRGMSIQDVATILGHADLKTTQIYCYISQSNVKAAYNKYGN